MKSTGSYHTHKDQRPKFKDQRSMTQMIKSEALPQEMQQHTYAIMYRVEGEHWWFVGRRRILENFVRKICQDLKKDLNVTRPHILDVGWGPGANLELPPKLGHAEGVEIPPDALPFCRARGLTNVSL